MSEHQAYDLPFPVRRRGFLATVAGALAAGTCGVRAHAETARPLRMQGIWTNDPESIGYFIGIDEGDYARAGLRIDYMPGGPELIPEGSLLTGKADIALLSMINAAQAVARKGADFHIIGAQYQKNPDAIISLESSGIRTPADLKGRTVACPPLNLIMLHALLRHAGIAQGAVRIVPYTFDPTPLVTGEVDAVIDYMTLLPWVVEKTGGKAAHYFFISDVGLPLYSNVLAVTGETLRARRGDLAGFLSASRAAWERNFHDPDAYPKRYASSWFANGGLTVDAMQAQNRAQQALMTGPKGFFALTPDDIAQNLNTLHLLNISATADMFDPSLLAV